MIAFILLFLALENTPPALDAAAGVLQLAPNNAKAQAQAQAWIGHNQLHLGRLADARANCDAALNLDTTNQNAKDCLDLLAIMLIDQDLNTADAKLLGGDRKAALDLASKWTRSIAQADRRARAWAIGLKTSALSDEIMADLQYAIFWLKECEKIAPSCSLYCDLAEAYLLRKEFSVAEAYGRHATLDSDQQTEAAHYIAAESFFLENTEASRALAKKYAESFKRPVTLEKFKALRRDLGIADAPTEAAPPTQSRTGAAAHA